MRRVVSIEVGAGRSGITSARGVGRSGEASLPGVPLCADAPALGVRDGRDTGAVGLTSGDVTLLDPTLCDNLGKSVGRANGDASALGVSPAGAADTAADVERTNGDADTIGLGVAERCAFGKYPSVGVFAAGAA